MRANYNRFLLTTCLSVMAIGAIGFTSANAGFEWTPPEKTAPVEVMPAPVDAPMPPVTTEDVSSEALPPIEMNDMQEEEEESPAIAITVMDDEETKDADLSELQKAVESVDNTDLEPEETITEDVAVEEEVEAIAEETPVEIIKEDPVEEYQEDVTVVTEPTVEEEVMVEEIDVEVIEQAPPAAPTSLQINPYPDEQAASNDTVVLPEDSQETLNDINSEDVVLEEEVAPQQPAETITWNEPETFDVIEGFGSDMPLALALRQIVPPKYAFSFGDGVNAGTKVSWDGGKPWNEVLSDALAPLKVDYTIKGNKVLLKVAPQKPVTVDTQATVEELQKVVDDAQAALDEQNKQDVEEEEIIVEEDVITEEEIEIIEVEPIIEDTEEALDSQSENDDIDSLTNSLLDENEHGHTQEDDVLAPTDTLDENKLKSMASDEEIIDSIDEQTEIIEIIEEGEEAPATEKAKSPLDDIYGTPSDAEEKMQPIEINPDEEASIPTPSEDVEQKAATIQRQNIMDPGEAESTQPAVTDMKQAVTETAEKKK